MAVSYPPMTTQQRLNERSRTLSDLIAATVAERGLPHDAELDIWRVMSIRVERIVELTDAAVAARAELAAHDARLDRHVRQHRECIRRPECADYQALVRQHCRLQRNADRVMRALLGERR